MKALSFADYEPPSICSQHLQPSSLYPFICSAHGLVIFFRLLRVFRQVYKKSYAFKCSQSVFGRNSGLDQTAKPVLPHLLPPKPPLVLDSPSTTPTPSSAIPGALAYDDRTRHTRHSTFGQNCGNPCGPGVQTPTKMEQSLSNTHSPASEFHRSKMTRKMAGGKDAYQCSFVRPSPDQKGFTQCVT